ncbi:MAG: DNA polymerase/3'-5' exonuclease PolX [Clostridia bacterium]|jgi:DNA polymerase (family 10)|nr:DNA polymerase/3'-5' exonuclease PolX [Clostridia bacterium]
MTNQEIAWKLLEISSYLELKGESGERAKGLKKAADIMLKLKHQFKLGNNSPLESDTGINTWAREIITSLSRRGHSPLLEQMRRSVPPGLVEMLAIPGLKAKDINIIYRKLGIKDLNSLLEAAKKNQIRKLPGIGSKTELAIIRGFKLLRENMNDAPIGIAKPLGEELVHDLSQIKQVRYVQVVGPLRRGEEMVDRVEIALAGANPAEVLKIISNHPQVKKIVTETELELTFISRVGIMVSIFIVPGENFGGYTNLLTGTEEFLEELSAVAKGRGINLSEPATYEFVDEQGLYDALNIDYIDPVIRDAKETVRLATAKKLPELLRAIDIKGDLHCHTNWSDGIAGIKEMADKAKEMGYEYLAITDHSKSLAVARGLSETKLLEQGEEIARLNETYTGFSLLKGIEVDILKKGKLDYDDQLLAGMDVVVASIHSGFQMDEEEMTDRITTAIKNPHVNILAHPTGRILGGRKGYQVNIEELIQVAAKTNTVLEINSSTERLDLNHILVNQAETRGVKISINTDSHDPLRLSEMEYGITVANKARLKKDNVINTYHIKELKDFFGNQKGHK